MGGHVNIKQKKQDGVEPKIGGKTPKMDGLFHGKPYEQMDDLGGFPPIFGNTQMATFGISLGYPDSLFLMGVAMMLVISAGFTDVPRSWKWELRVVKRSREAVVDNSRSMYPP